MLTVNASPQENLLKCHLSFSRFGMELELDTFNRGGTSQADLADHELAQQPSVCLEGLAQM